MRLKSFSYFTGLLIIFFGSHLASEEKIDIWKNKEIINKDTSVSEDKKTEEIPNLNTSQAIKASDKIEIQDGNIIEENQKKVYGIYEPANYDFSLNMWTSTKDEKI